VGVSVSGLLVQTSTPGRVGEELRGEVRAGGRGEGVVRRGQGGHGVRAGGRQREESANTRNLLYV
jgi:hypothetical protein